MNLLSLTGGIFCFPRTIQWGGNYVGYAPSTEEPLCLGCSAIFKNELQDKDKLCA